jgi:hypothetical protein
MTAQPGAELEDISLRDIDLRYVAVDDPALKGASVGGSQFSNTTPWARCERAAVVGENIRDLDLAGLRIRWPEGEAPPAWCFPQKMANGTHELFVPADWQSAAGMAGVSLRGVHGGGLSGSRITGFRGAPAMVTAASQWPTT